MTNDLEKILNNLKNIAETNKDFRLKGKRQYEYDLPDYIFSSLVSEDIEQDILDLMIKSKIWERGTEGFFLKD